MGETGQMELFPSPSPSDIQQTRELLNKYVRMRKAVQEIGTMTNPSERWKQVQVEYAEKTANIEMAVRLIVDDNVRRVMDFRFIRGNPRWGTIKRFSSVTDRSIDRQIVRGIESVAETLKLIGVI
ncbi:hypothetical protein [Paenibacillus sp. DR312]|uniref:hypothetical protein n=2 Tax=unclassified Paenibacillus TaxID=185978 RepID=UPI001C9659F4|nr:hypothetical protein [Paenibacillus sp. DR312]QZN77361.1 hypothetical protein K5K90_09265 [Paenibacillus sp. DR312]